MAEEEAHRATEEAEEEDLAAAVIVVVVTVAEALAVTEAVTEEGEVVVIETVAVEAALVIVAAVAVEEASVVEENAAVTRKMAEEEEEAIVLDEKDLKFARETGLANAGTSTLPFERSAILARHQNHQEPEVVPTAMGLPAAEEEAADTWAEGRCATEEEEVMAETAHVRTEP